MDENTIPPAAWSASGFTGNLGDGIELSDRDWTSTRGDYTGLTDIWITVRTDRWSYGTAFQGPELRTAATSLPEGTYLVNGTAMTTSDYQKHVEQFPCPSPQN